MLELSHKVAVYIPSTSNVSQADQTLQQNEVTRIATAFSQKFGGCTAEAVKGYWLSDTAGLVVETPIRVWAFCAEFDPADVLALAESIKRNMSQEAVLIELDNIGVLV